MITITGLVDRVRWHNPETGWTILSLKPEQTTLFHGSTLTAVGQFHPEPFADETLTLSGDWTTHTQYGEQFKVERVVGRTSPQTRDGLVAYLASGLFPGIGDVIAARIVDHFGDDTADVFDRTPQRLAEVRGITAAKAADIAAVWRDEQDAREAMTYLCGLGLTTTMAGRIYRTYQDNTVTKVRENPYRLAWDVDGIGFKRADTIARGVLHCHDADPRRIQAGLLHALKETRDDGHVYLPRNELVDAAAALLGLSDQDVIGSTLDGMATRDLFGAATKGAAVVVDEQVSPEPVVYLPQLHFAENNAARRLVIIQKTNSGPIGNPEKLAALINATEVELGLIFDPKQRAAIQMALTSKVSVITGGPGTGKSVLLRAITNVLQARSVTMTLCAPTGRAAKRMTETTGVTAATIHRTLQFKPGRYGGGSFEKNETDPLYTAFVLVDECSMVDIALFNNLLQAMPDRARLLLVGDVDQLPSVGPGNVLRDLINSDRLPITRLDTIFRQSERSKIITNAHAINAGRMPDTANDSDDFFFFAAETQEQIRDQILEIVCRKLPGKFGYDPLRDVQVLSPMYKGAAGVDSLNRHLQQALNPPNALRTEHAAFNELRTKRRTLRVGDKVMQLRNNYELDVYNGDTGFIRAIDSEKKQLVVAMEGREVMYRFQALDQLTHAFACTIHKSQGSEYPVVVMPVTTAHYIMLRRNLLYTSITRGKKTVVLVGSRQAIGIAVNTAVAEQRYSALARRLRLAIPAGSEPANEKTAGLDLAAQTPTARTRIGGQHHVRQHR